ncbi:MAG: hypothetical protein Gaeavirus38_2 [Gaeavirus sp.]|uniref:OTU domain-containing protein n=1 Tax=Gaeavirus sp. TaxID=2487767 RepID=A0A3G4ZZF3_9VIRU|nr:MAG: hypothetical protein Gaeavirus38_2 [Gaeavirus sp.]
MEYDDRDSDYEDDDYDEDDKGVKIYGHGHESEDDEIQLFQNRYYAKPPAQSQNPLFEPVFKQPKTSSGIFEDWDSTEGNASYDAEFNAKDNSEKYFQAPSRSHQSDHQRHTNPRDPREDDFYNMGLHEDTLSNAQHIANFRKPNHMHHNEPTDYKKQEWYKKQKFEEPATNQYDINYIYYNLTAKIDSLSKSNPNVYYPDFYDMTSWTKFLGREMTLAEIQIINNVLTEDEQNNKLKTLHKTLLTTGLFMIPNLTKDNGNCLFESLHHLDLGKPNEIRHNIAALLLSIRDIKHFFPNIESSPEELFNDTNELHAVYADNEPHLYNYDMMIADLYTNNSWTRLPTELILMTISRIYEIIIIIHSNIRTEPTIINVWNEEDAAHYDKVHLGHIDDSHYIPIIKIDDDLASEKDTYDEISSVLPLYNDAVSKYKRWATQTATALFEMSDDYETSKYIQKTKATPGYSYASDRLKLGLDNPTYAPGAGAGSRTNHNYEYDEM